MIARNPLGRTMAVPHGSAQCPDRMNVSGNATISSQDVGRQRLIARTALGNAAIFSARQRTGRTFAVSVRSKPFPQCQPRRPFVPGRTDPGMRRASSSLHSSARLRPSKFEERGPVRAQGAPPTASAALPSAQTGAVSHAISRAGGRRTARTMRVRPSEARRRPAPGRCRTPAGAPCRPRPVRARCPR